MATAARETLWCDVGGHNWERERRRGVKPLSCEEHRATAKKAANRDRRLRSRGRAPAVAAVVDRTEHERRKHPLDPLYGAVADASIAVNFGRDCAKPLRHVAAVAELLSLDPIVTEPRA